MIMYLELQLPKLPNWMPNFEWWQCCQTILDADIENWQQCSDRLPVPGSDIWCWWWSLLFQQESANLQFSRRCTGSWLEWTTVKNKPVTGTYYHLCATSQIMQENFCFFKSNFRENLFLIIYLKLFNLTLL